ncbi:MAG: hypothetical protein FWE87_06505 [Coriobacteriia bacterium]|nr:hypothetical protein [Coriobacteriia bacterium]
MSKTALDTTTDTTTKPKKSFVARANDLIANKAALMLSSMWMFWVIMIVLAIAYGMQPPKGAYEIVIFFVGAGFQAIALPVLAFVSNIQGDRQEAKLDKMQKDIHKELRLIKKLIKEVKEEQSRLEELHGMSHGSPKNDDSAMLPPNV